jgi:hypothetical protein
METLDRALTQAQLKGAQRVAQMVSLAAQAKQFAREAAWELGQVHVALERNTATVEADIATVEQHRVRAMERLAQAMAATTELEMAMAKLEDATGARGIMLSAPQPDESAY